MESFRPGDIVTGKVIGTKPYGAFILIGEKIVGLLHISEISDNYVHDVNDYIKVGESIKIKILDIDYKDNKAKLSLKALESRNKKRRKRNNLSEEVIDEKKEFKDIKDNLDEFINQAKIRLKI